MLHLHPSLADDGLMLLEDRLVHALDVASGRPARQQFGPGERLLTEGEQTRGIWLILEGDVRLSRTLDGADVALDDDASGRIIGLLSVESRGNAFFSCAAITPVVAALIPWTHLDAVLHADPDLAGQFTMNLARALGARVRHIADLQADVQRLNDELTTERDRLQVALRDLASAQTRLIENDRLAVLGQLVAGIAHELNNPVTAIRRAADYVLEDVSDLLGSQPGNDVMLALVESAITMEPVSTETLRNRAQTLAQEVQDPSIASRLVKIGVIHRADAERLLGRTKSDAREAQLNRLERAFELGTFLRNIRTASDRVSAIVQTLKTYARSSGGAVADININRGLDDTLLLFSSKTRSIEVQRSFEPVSTVEGDPAQLNQVWTNLVSNAIEAINGSGTLEVATRCDGSDVVVHVIDSGGGIPQEHVARIFDLNFTTKRGPTGFGLGMGLAICQQIVARHEGRIRVAESGPGRTVFEVRLPQRLSPDARRSIEQGAQH
jgi:C4-dicarboxylate-specific signal transduction histidine kinase